MLSTRAHNMYYGNDKTCLRCGVYEETMKRVIFECNDFYYTEEELLCRLGLHEEANNATEVKGMKGSWRTGIYLSTKKLAPDKKALLSVLMETTL